MASIPATLITGKKQRKKKKKLLIISIQGFCDFSIRQVFPFRCHRWVKPEAGGALCQDESKIQNKRRARCRGTKEASRKGGDGSEEEREMCRCE